MKQVSAAKKLTKYYSEWKKIGGIEMENQVEVARIIEKLESEEDREIVRSYIANLAQWLFKKAVQVSNMKDIVEVAESFLIINTCADCGKPVVQGWACTFCGSKNPEGV
jgi:hypothetical protein